MISRLVRYSIQARPIRASTSIVRAYSSFFGDGPAPPKLPKEEQAEFEKLQRQANSRIALEMTEEELEELRQGSKADQNVAEGLHPEYREVYADFEGEKNPETGEIGGPKQDPLRHGDYSFNGRVTDF